MLPRVVVLVAISAVLALVAGDRSGNAGILTPDFVVNSTGDSSDFNIGDGKCDVFLMPVGDQCTLRAALEENSLTSFGSKISFNIPGAGPHAITPGTTYFTLMKPVFIDGYSQPGSSANTLGLGEGSNAQPMIEIDLKNLPNASYGLQLVGNGSTVRGLAIHETANTGRVNGIFISGDNNHVEGNFLGTDASGTLFTRLLNGVFILGGSNNVVGGLDPADKNVLLTSDPAGSANGNGIRLNDAVATQIEGNLIGTDNSGLEDMGSGVGIRIGGGSRDTIVGSSANAAARNVISGNQVGVLVAEDNTTNNQIAGNFIGVGVDGTTEVDNSVGVLLLGGTGNYVGKLGAYPGSCTAGCNVISGNAVGVDVSSIATDNFIAANHIGVDANGAPMPNTLMGISLRLGAANTFIQSNVIAHNEGAGVLLRNQAGSGNLLANNRIYANEGLGVDIALSGETGDGVTPNDAGDADSGPNDVLNFPVLTSAVAGSAEVEGTYDGLANTEITLAFFSNDECDSSGNGEGQTPLGTSVMMTDGDGHADFDVTLADSAPAGSFVTALAITVGPSLVTGNTSEFSNCVEVQAAPTPTPTPAGQTPTPTPSATPSGQSPTPTLAPGERVWGDLDCSGQAVGADAVKGIRYVANPSSAPSGGCPSPGSMVEVQGFGSLMWGDHDCSGTVLAADQLPLLRYIGGLPQQPSEALCPLVGAVVVVTG